MKLSNSIMKDNSKNIKLKKLYIRIERLRWNNVMKKRFWKKHGLLRPCVSRICRQLLNFELEKKKNFKVNCLPSNQTKKLGIKKDVIEKEMSSKNEDHRINEIVIESPRKKLKISSKNFSDDEKENVEKKPPNKGKINEYERDNNNDSYQIKDSSMAKNVSTISKSQNNFEESSSNNSITLYTTSGIKVISTKSVTIPKSKVSNLLYCQKGIQRKQLSTLSAEINESRNTLFEELSPSNSTANKDKTKENMFINPSDKIKLHDNKCKVVVEEEHLLEDVEEMEKPKIPPNLLESVEKLPPDPSSTCTKSQTEEETDPLDDKAEESCEDQSSLESMETVSIDSDGYDNDSSCSDSQELESPEIDSSINLSEFLACSIETEDQEDLSKTGKDIPIIKSQNYQLNCDARVVIKPLLPKLITFAFCFENKINFTNASRIRKEILLNEFMGKYGSKNPNDLPSANSNSFQQDNQDAEVFPTVDIFTHSLFAPIIKRDRRNSKNTLRKFRNSFRNYILNFNKSGPDSNKNNLTKVSNIKIGNTQYTRVYDNCSPTSLFRPVITSENHSIKYQPQNFTIVRHLPTSSVSSGNIDKPLLLGESLLIPSSQSNPIVQSTAPFFKPLPNGNISTLSSLSPVGNSSNVFFSPNTPIAFNSFNSLPNSISYAPSQPYLSTRPVLVTYQNPGFKQMDSFLTTNSVVSFQKPYISTAAYVTNTTSITTSAIASVITNPTIYTNSIPPLKMNVTRLTNPTTMAKPVDFSNHPNINQRTVTLSSPDTVINNRNIVSSPFIKENVKMCHSKISDSSHSSSSSSIFGNDDDEIEVIADISFNRSFVIWLTELKKVGDSCKCKQRNHWLKDQESVEYSCCNYENEITYNSNLLHRFKQYLSILVSFGFPKEFSCLSNVIYQLLRGEICCSHHSLLIVNGEEWKKMFRESFRDSSNDETNETFNELHLPSLKNNLDIPTLSPGYNMFILKRMVFVIDKVTRTVLYPLPSSCNPRDNDVIDKITLLILVSPKFGLGPGLIVFPHSILGSSLLLSLQSIGPSCSKWCISSHQKGGLTQAMMIEFLNNQALEWINEKRVVNQPTYLIVDWWWCLEGKMLHGVYNTFTLMSASKLYPNGKDPFEVGVTMNIQRLWGLLVKKWKTTHTTLSEHQFPQFIFEILTKLCSSQRLLHWCGASGLFPLDPVKTYDFYESLCNM